mgnify:CR=1 FL=1
MLYIYQYIKIENISIFGYRQKNLHTKNMKAVNNEINILLSLFFT